MCCVDAFPEITIRALFSVLSRTPSTIAVNIDTAKLPKRLLLKTTSSMFSFRKWRDLTIGNASTALNQLCVQMYGHKVVMIRQSSIFVEEDLSSCFFI